MWKVIALFILISLSPVCALTPTPTPVIKNSTLRQAWTDYNSAMSLISNGGIIQSSLYLANKTQADVLLQKAYVEMGKVVFSPTANKRLTNSLNKKIQETRQSLKAVELLEGLK